jgi:SAM-dependent methyltransferase
VIVDSLAWDERYAGDDLVWSAEPNRFLVAEVETLPPGRALDLACGEGRNAVWLAERDWEVTGVDFSNVGLDKARRLAEARGVPARWELADVTEYTPAPQSFDLVIVMYLHLPEAARRVAFRHAAASVAAGGTLLIVGHDITNRSDGFGGPSDTAVLYGPEDVVADLDGLEAVKAERVRRPVPTDDGEKIAIDVLVRAARTSRKRP